MTSRTAIHEAAHAVIGLVLRLPVVSASIEPDGDSQGRVAFKESILREHDCAAIAQMVLAAPCAVYKHFSREDHDDDDHARLATILLVDVKDLSPAAKASALADGRNSTMALLEAHWPAVLAVARALDERRNLALVEIEEIVHVAGAMDVASRRIAKHLVRREVHSIVDMLLDGHSTDTIAAAIVSMDDEIKAALQAMFVEIGSELATTCAAVNETRARHGEV